MDNTIMSEPTGGLDYKDRLEDVRFIVEVDNFVKELKDDSISRYGLMGDESIYYFELNTPQLAAVGMVKKTT